MSENDQVLRITPKGDLVAILLNHGITSLDEADAITHEFVSKIQQRCDHDEIRGTPCVILEGGWHLIGAQRNDIT